MARCYAGTVLLEGTTLSEGRGTTRPLELFGAPELEPRRLLAAMADFGENVLGKGIVYGKDTPNFVGNRIGTFGITSVFHWMKEFGLGVTQVDKVFGPATGRPKSAIFRTADVVGLDTLAHVLTTVKESAAGIARAGRDEADCVLNALARGEQVLFPGGDGERGESVDKSSRFARRHPLRLPPRYNQPDAVALIRTGA